MRAIPTVVAVSTVLALTTLGGRTAEAHPVRSVDFTAILKPSLVVPEPRNVSARASGRLIGRFGAGCIWGCMATYRLSFTHLTGVPADIVIRFGGPGETGHVWRRLCSRHRGRGECPRARHGTVRGQFVVDGYPRSDSLDRYDFYVEISTARHPLGEVRGQIDTR